MDQSRDKLSSERWCASRMDQTLQKPKRYHSFKVPGHCGIRGKEAAEDLARDRADLSSHGPEPYLGTAKKQTIPTLKGWVLSL